MQNKTMTAAKNDCLRNLPSVDDVLKQPAVQELLSSHSRTLVVRAIQGALDEKRQRILSMSDPEPFVREGAQGVTAEMISQALSALMSPSLKRVINATGIIVHTNLGRAPLSEVAVQAAVEAARSYSNLEFDIAAGCRGSRYVHVEGLLKELTGAEAGFVVNNNAAAVLICLTTLARDREVIISRGELIEIGGSFRIPDIMVQSGARLVEVGATNRTHLHDYLAAISERTALILKAHTSNYRIVGFSSEVNAGALAQLGKEHAVPVMLDMGSGNLVEGARLGLGDEPVVRDALKSGVDLVTFSGDKLLGGPQAGIILGSRRFVKMICRNPLARALRIDKLTLAALEATLRTYALEPDRIETIPVMRMLMTSGTELKRRAGAVLRKIRRKAPDLDVCVAAGTSQVGGGAYPLHDLPTWLLSVGPPTAGAEGFEQRLRAGSPPVIARISKDRVLLDMRTVLPGETGLLADAICRAAAPSAQP